MHTYRLIIPKELWALVKAAAKASTKCRSIVAWIEAALREKLERDKPL